MNCLELLTEIQKSTKEVYIASDYEEYLKNDISLEDNEIDLAITFRELLNKKEIKK
jgi:hypothetical protein